MNLSKRSTDSMSFPAAFATTASTDRLIVKVVLGRYFNWGIPRHRTPPPPPV
jgi:hypothetical protein